MGPRKGEGMRSTTCGSGHLSERERLITSPVRNRFQAQVGIGRQALTQEPDGNAECLRGVVTGVVGRGVEANVPACRGAIIQMKRDVVVRTHALLSVVRGAWRERLERVERSGIRTKILEAGAGVDAIFHVAPSIEP